MQRKFAVVAVGLLLAAQSASAEDEGPWKAKAGLGYLASAGNSDTTNFSGVFDIGYERARWHHTLGLLAAGADAEGVSTAERYAVTAKSKRDIRKHDYLFALVDYEKDKFSGYDQQISETVGYGRRFLDTDKQVLNADLGVGFRQQRLRDGNSDDSAIIRLGADYLYKISETSEFIQLLAIEPGPDNTYIEGVSEIKATLEGALSLVFSFTVKANSEVPAGLEKRDTFTSINLEYDFR